MTLYLVESPSTVSRSISGSGHAYVKLCGGRASSYGRIGGEGRESSVSKAAKLTHNVVRRCFKFAQSGQLEVEQVIMQHSRKILLKLASASDNVITAANEFADRQDLNSVPRSHFQLEVEMGKITVACEGIAEVLHKSTLSETTFDVRLQDWLDSYEPQQCLDTLKEIETSLKDEGGWLSPTHDKIKQAFDLFRSRDTHFRFLSEFPKNTSKKENGAGQQDLHASRECIAQGKPSLLEQGFPFLPIDINTAEPDTASYPDRHTAENASYKTPLDKDQKEYTKKLEEVLKWLDGWDCAEKQEDTLSLRQPNTCKWLFDTTQYKTWRDPVREVGSFLWLRGKQGAGKSVLASSVIEALNKSLRDGETIAFFYCDFRNERSQNSAEALRSLLSQLLIHFRGDAVSRIGDVINGLIEEKERGGPILRNSKLLAKFAYDAANLLTRSPLVVVDALDECKDLKALVESLTRLKPYVRLFVTSRPREVIKDCFSGLPSVSMDDAGMSDMLSQDIKLHVNRQLAGCRRLSNLETEIKKQIYEVLCHKADGMWVQCSLDMLNRCATPNDVQEVLETLPQGLEGTYGRIIVAIDLKTRKGQLAKRALVWLIAALRPLHLTELTEGLSIDVRRRTVDSSLAPLHRGALLDACGSLVMHIEKTDTITLSHSSVKEYLINTLAGNIELSEYHIPWKRAHFQLAQSCMWYISVYLQQSRQIGNGTSAHIAHDNGHSLDRPSLLRYVLDYGIHHFGHLETRITAIFREIKALEEVVDQYADVWDTMVYPQTTCNTESHIQTCWPTSKQDFLLYILVAVAPVAILRTFLRTPLNVKKGANPLLYAAYFNKRDHAQILLLHGAKLNVQGWRIVEPDQALPIEVALTRRNYSIVDLFVQNGSTVPRHVFTRLLSVDDASAVIPITTANILLRTDEFVETPEAKDESALWRLALVTHPPSLSNIQEQARMNVIKRIVQLGVDPLTSDSQGKTPLCMAVQEGHVFAAEYLISVGALATSDLLLAALNSRSSSEEKAPMIHCLIKNGANARAVWTETGDNLLHIATARSFDEEDVLETAKLLVLQGCDANAVNFSRWTPLHNAVQRGHLSVAKYLLSHGAHLPPDILTTLELWFLPTKAPMVRYLVENKADVHVRTRSGDSILHIVLRCHLQFGNDAMEIVELLIGRNCDAFQVNSSGETPLCVAVQWGHVSVARFLISHGAPITPDLLFVALTSVRIFVKAPIVRCLVDKGVNARARTQQGDSALHVALRSLNEDDVLEIANLLVKQGCDAFDVNPCGETPFKIAVERGFHSVAQCFLSPSAPSGVSKALAAWSSWRLPDSEKIRMMRLLLESEPDVQARATNGNTIFQVALESLQSHDDALQATKLLVDHNCDPLDASSSGRTPFLVALECGHTSVADFFLSIGIALPDDILFSALSSEKCWNRIRMMDYLITQGARVNVRAHNGDSLLHVAVISLSDD
ncbi:ankyrin repeat-containing domain protein [Chiua virens]|nr:ankyrin repeat-containing domain protein [Chiua virens]